MKKLHPLKAARQAAIVLPLALLPFAASAQNSSNTSTAYGNSTGSSWLPYTSNGYVGINLGQPRFDDARCSGLFNCDDDNLAGKIYVGGMFNRNFGVELGYVDFGQQKRNGGESSAYGANISLVGNLPMDRFNLFAKVGSTYGWTKTSAVVGPIGDESGWGLSYGAGAGYDLSPHTQLLVEWDRHRFDFADADSSNVDMYTVGLKYRF